MTVSCNLAAYFFLRNRLTRKKVSPVCYYANTEHKGGCNIQNIGVSLLIISAFVINEIIRRTVLVSIIIFVMLGEIKFYYLLSMGECLL